VTAFATAGIGQSPSAPASASGSHAIGTVDLVRIFNDCVQITDLNDIMKQQADEIREEGKQRSTVVDNKQIALSAFQVGTADYEARRKELMQIKAEFNVWVQLAEQNMEQQKFDWTRVIYEKALVAAAEIGKSRGYSAVLQRYDFKPLEGERTVQALRRQIQDRAVVWSVPEIDITDEVVRRLDDDYRKAGGKKQVLHMLTTRPVAP
jgi:Skp family chaperone for outer membrane proteins